MLEMIGRPGIKICSRCLGTGKQKAMQRALINEKESVRVADTYVKCKHCNGAGIVWVSED